MPEPLQTPSSEIVFPACSTFAVANFARVSVVMIACMKLHSEDSLSDFAATSCGIARTSLPVGSGTPMIPGEDGNTNSGATLSDCPGATQTSLAALYPCSPVAQ